MCVKCERVINSKSCHKKIDFNKLIENPKNIIWDPVYLAHSASAVFDVFHGLIQLTGAESYAKPEVKVSKGKTKL